MAENNGKDPDKKKEDERGFSAPGITDLPQRLSRALGEAFGGPTRVLSSAASDLLKAAADAADASEGKKGKTLTTATESVARAAGGAVVESARVVEDVAGRFVSPSGDERPKLVRTGNRVYPMAPYLLEDTSIHAFFIPTDHDQLSNYLDKVFEEPTHGEVKLEPACDHIIALVADTKKVRTANDDEDRKGYTPDDDAALWAFALRTKPTLKLCFVPIYHFVEAAPSLSAGREIYGFPKQLAKVKVPPQITKSKPTLKGTLLNIEPHVLEKLNDEGTLRRKSVLTISRTPASTTTKTKPPATSPTTSTTTAASGIQGMFEELADVCLNDGINKSLKIARKVQDFLEALGIDFDNFSGRIPMLFLKQVPSITDSSTCAYQAVVEADLVVETLQTHGLEKDIDLTLSLPPAGTKEGYPSHPFQEIGLDGTNPQISKRVFWMKGNLRLTHGKVISSWPR